MEEVSFVYEKIEWTWVAGSITATDDWAANQNTLVKKKNKV
jgi:type VI protein secretion system component Hcp